jgi:hypothetical protein
MDWDAGPPKYNEAAAEESHALVYGFERYKMRVFLDLILARMRV